VVKYQEPAGIVLSLCEALPPELSDRAYDRTMAKPFKWTDQGKPLVA
jgi:hypothetical protein